MIFDEDLKKEMFSFAKFLDENFEYFDNVRTGDVYKHKEDKGLYSEEDIFDEWYNNERNNEK